eukprot:CAMPEP_0181177298 /NCGR_PEP_ID=MMETSP1096-20121128/5087_1 /TAXON_ID=156174 ORGANISM="Chrysochromulina ericina, Strain CCMP281" /NCGR_SAMPLE_ID=MMETSP1096 /ASSEMBLY_ACC=CAM_ASM_000453 /LENGTH=1084 /DNA_ID=CAMNT_0023265441 /DNA_START=72 /DNA_END=3327 /DNA_ORIENTATION=-
MPPQAEVGEAGTAAGTSSSPTAVGRAGAMANQAIPPEGEADGSSSASGTSSESSIMLLVTCICCCLRNVRTPQLTLKCMRLLHHAAVQCEDSVRTQRALPYFVAMLQDPAPLVRSEAVTLIASLLSSVCTLEPSDDGLMPEYVLPALARVGGDSEEVVRCALAASIASFAETAGRFLEVAQWMRRRDSSASVSLGGTEFSTGAEGAELRLRSYDKELATLQEQISRIVVQLLTDPDSGPAVKRLMLTDVTRLCVFMQRQNTNDLLLPLLITFLNDRDPMLRCCFFEKIHGVCAFVGRASLQAFVLPCILQALTDTEELVVSAALQSLCRLAEISLHERAPLLDIASKSAPLLIHPNSWVRHGAIGFFDAIARHFSLGRRGLLAPQTVAPSISRAPAHILAADDLEPALKPPVTRRAFDQALACVADVSPFIAPATSVGGALVGDTTLSSVDEGGEGGDADLIAAVAAADASDVEGTGPDSAAHLTHDVPNPQLGTRINAPLDLSALVDLEPSDASLLQAMREYIRSASVAKMAKVKMWETDNSALLQLAGGGGGGELIHFRSLSQHVPVQRNVAPPAECAATGSSSGPPHGGDDAAVTRILGRSRAAVAAAATPQGKAALPAPTDTQMPYGQRPPTELRPRPAAARGSAGGERPVQARLLATLYGHKEGVSLLASSPSGRVAYSSGRRSSLMVWVTSALAEETVHRAIASHAPPSGASAVGLCACPGEESVALGYSDNSVHVLAAARLGSPEASSAKMCLEPSDGRLLTVTCMEGSGGLVCYSTEAGGVHAWDLRCAREAWRLPHERTLGLLQATTADAAANWMVAGSSSGHCMMWDLRYSLRLRTWLIPGKHRIRTMLHTRPPGQPRPLVLCGSENNVISGWEIGGQPRCSVVLQPSDVTDATVQEVAAPLLKEPTSDGSWHQLPLSVAAAAASAKAAAATAASIAATSTTVLLSQHSVRTILAPFDGSYVISAGSDMRARYWRLEDDASKSALIVGQAADEPPPSYEERLLQGSCRVVRELQPPHVTGTVTSFIQGGATPLGVSPACTAAITCSTFCGGAESGLLMLGSLDGTVRGWRLVLG